MSDDYLWDGSGPPDPEIHRLERLLSRFRHKRPAPGFAAPASLAGQLHTLFTWTRLAAVAAGLALILAAGLALRRPQITRQLAPRTAAPVTSPKPAWDVARLKGTPKVASKAIGETGRLAEGEWLETDNASFAEIAVAVIGEVRVDPNTRVRLVETRANQHRMALDRGTIHATIWAPPGQFYVDTPSAVAVDLGCAYTLQVDDHGAGLITVTFGWVGFESHGRESFIPAGALCATRPGIGPGTPYLKDTSKEFQAALATLDFEKAPPSARALALGTILTQTRKRDALSLWHLLSRVDEGERTRVYDRLAGLVPPPPGVSRQGILRADQRMLDLWWDQLGLGAATWWRMWERKWQTPSR